MTLKILIAEDARDVAEVVAFGARMTWPGCEITVAGSGEEALQHFVTAPADLVVLDISMPSPNGLEVCQRIRAVSRVPILMLTARDALLDKVRAFDLGADDYVTKPFDPLELFARLRSLLRRASESSVQSATTFAIDSFTLDYAAEQISVNGDIVPLTSTEYRLLETLVRHAGTVMSHQTLLEQVWGPEYKGDTHYLKGVVRRLRQKIGDDAENPHYIKTAWGTGYKFIAPYQA